MARCLVMSSNASGSELIGEMYFAGVPRVGDTVQIALEDDGIQSVFVVQRVTHAPSRTVLEEASILISVQRAV